MKNAEKLKLFTPVKDRPVCLFCKKVLREDTRLDKEAHEAFYQRMGAPTQEQYKRMYGLPTGRFGYGGTGYFCTLTCGYQWAVRQCNAITGRGQK